MLLAAIFGIVNAFMSFLGNRVVGFSAFDLSVSFVAIAVWHGNNPLLSAFILVMSYTLVDARELRFLWITLPVTILIAFLAIYISNIYVLIFIYHAIGATSAYFLQYFSTKYWLFMLMNISANILAARLYTAFFL